jgi:hypothetical protein
MEYFTHLPEFQVIICKECQHAVLPSHIDVHFVAKPQHGLEKKEQRRIIEAIVEIDGLIGNEETLSQCEFPFPLATSKPIAVLAEPKQDYIQCTFEVVGKVCQYICSTIQRMWNHCWEEHGWKSEDKGGRPKRRNHNNKNIPWRTDIHC